MKIPVMKGEQPVAEVVSALHSLAPKRCQSNTIVDRR
jgi:hypothetical protein